MNYTRFSRTGKEQQTLLFLERSRGNEGEFPLFFFSRVPYNEKKVVTIEFSYTRRSFINHVDS